MYSTTCTCILREYSTRVRGLTLSALATHSLSRSGDAVNLRLTGRTRYTGTRAHPDSLRLTGRTRYNGTRAHSCGALHVMLSSTLSRGQAPRHARHHALPWSGPPRTYSPPGASGGGGARVPGSEAPLHYHMSKVQLSKQLVVCVSNWLRNLQLRALSTSAAPVRLIGLRGDHV